MSWSMALNIGDAFAEAIVFRAKERHQNRWFLPGQQFPKTLSDWLTAQGITSLSEVRLCTNWARTILQRQLSSSPAFLVTSGFEGWLEMNAQRRNLVDQNRVLGVNERTGADGSIVATPTPEDLEFVVSKLKLLKTKTVAVGFLHSSKNPTNEDLVGAFLQEAGFKVFKAHDIQSTSSGGETARWHTLLEQAAIEEVFSDWCTKLRTALAEILPEGQPFLVLTENGFQDVAKGLHALATASGPKLSAFQFARARNPDSTATYFGFDEFEDQVLGSISLQPLQTLKAGIFGFVSLDNKTIQFETGPMGWGRGQNATVLDVVWRAQLLTEPQEILQRFTDRGRRRIDETLLALSRPLVTEERMSAEPLLDLILGDLKARLQNLTPRFATGPLARSFRSLLPAETHLDTAAQGFESCLGLYEELR